MLPLPLTRLVLLVIASLLLAATPRFARADGEPFRDPALPLDTRVADLLSRLTLEEKATVLNHRGATLARFNLRADQWNQCLNGVKWDRPATLFPTCIAMAATWDKDLVREIATALSDEARAIYNGWRLDPAAPGEHKGLIYRAPVINIGRNPYWGRNHEAFGEDPYLTGRMAVAYVRGLQGDDPRYLKIAATLKHYAVNNVETDRQKLNAVVSEGVLRQYWLPHFRDAVVEGKAQSLMASYNAINGTPNNINRWLLTDLLKGEWKHEGFVVSDLGGVRTMVSGHAAGKMTYVDAVAQSVMAGCDFSDKEYETHIPAAVREGKLTLARLDDAVKRVLKVRFRLGEFDPFESVPFSRIKPDIIGGPAHRELALKVARESIVLLQNKGDLLPLDKSRLKRIAVIGPLADKVIFNNYSGKAGATVTPLQGITDRAAKGVEILHAAGCGVVTGGAASGAIATKVDHEDGFSAGASIKLEATAIGQFIEFSVDLPEPGKYEIKLHYKSFPSRGIYRLGIDGVDQGDPLDMHAAPGQYGQVATFGNKTFTSAGVKQFRFTAIGKNPRSTALSGHFDKLTLTGPKDLSLEAEQLKSTVGRGVINDVPSIEQAAALARGADVAIVFVGTTPQVEHEGRDRKTLGLTGAQDDLVKAVLAANPRTIVVQCSAGPLTVPWIKENVPALLQAWWGGEEGGHAIADVLFGDASPAGRLPHTVYASESQVPPLDRYDIAEGFTYMHVKGEPLFPFGHGLAYTRFAYSQPAVSSPAFKSGESLTFTVQVENTGPRAGDEVVQFYVRSLPPAPNGPRLQLRGFERIALAPGEKKTVRFTLRPDQLARWDPKAAQMRETPGDYEALIGASSSDIRQRIKFNLAGD